MGIEIKFSTLGYYFDRWELSVQRPIKRAYKQDQKQIDKWLNEEFTSITKRAEEENAEIFFGDKTNIQNTMNYLLGYVTRPLSSKQSKKQKISSKYLKTVCANCAGCCIFTDETRYPFAVRSEATNGEGILRQNFRDPNKFCVKPNKALPIRQDLEQGKI